MTTFTAFVRDLRAEPSLAVFADAVAEAHRGLELESVHNRDALQVWKAVNWILSQPRTVREKLDALCKLTALPRAHVLIPSMKRFLGW